MIAEWEDDQNVLTGRSRARAPDEEVQITLASQDDKAVPPARTSASRKVNPIANRAEDDDVEAENLDEKPAPARNGGVETLPPAPEAESLPPTRSRPARRNPPAVEAPVPMTARWRRGDPCALGISFSRRPRTGAGRRRPDRSSGHRAGAVTPLRPTNRRRRA